MSEAGVAAEGISRRPEPAASTWALSYGPATKGFGELLVEYSGGAAFTIVRADPRIRVSGELLRAQFGVESMAAGAKLAVNGTDRRVLYVIGGHCEGIAGGGDWYEAQWPD